MGLTHELPIYRDTYKLLLKIYQYTQGYSREYKYTLGQDMKRDGLELVRSIYRANRSREKRGHLEAFLEQYELLKMEIRLSGALRLLSLKQMADITLLMDGIGRQASGWKRSQGG
jgi:hypothetical protein